MHALHRVLVNLEKIKITKEYLKNNIPYLKQRFEEQNIPYASLSYRGQKHQRNNNSGQNNKEKDNE